MREEEGAAGAPVWASLSARGGRSENQDRCGEGPLPGGRVFVVADGLGGHAGGAVAAEACVGAILAAARTAAFTPGGLRALFEAGHRAVQDAQRRDPAVSGCRTTAAVLLISEGRALWGHVGDTRLYHLRGGRIAFQTLDHSVPQALVQTGAIEPSEIRSHPDRNRLLRSLGGEEEVAPALLDAPCALEPGDRFLLCSDGLWEHVTEAEMEALLREALDPDTWLRRLEARLLETASGAFDNYSALAVFLEPAAAPAPRAGRGLRVALSLAAGVLLALGVQRCLREPEPGHVFGARSAPGLPMDEAAAGSDRAPRLHSRAGGPRCLAGRA